MACAPSPLDLPTSTPTSSCWLNAVEGFFAKLTRRRLKHGVFRSVTELQAAINRFIAEHNEQPQAVRLASRPKRHHRGNAHEGSKRWSQSARISTFPRHPFPMLPPRRWRARSRSALLRRRALAACSPQRRRRSIVVTSRSSFHRIDRPLCCPKRGGPSSCADRHSRRAVRLPVGETFAALWLVKGGAIECRDDEIAIGPELRAHAVRKPGTGEFAGIGTAGEAGQDPVVLQGAQRMG